MALIVGVTLLAQAPKPSRLIDQAPYDLLTLDKANDSKVVKVYPIDLPGRQVPQRPRGSDKLRVKLLEDSQEYEVAWANIAKLQLFEQMVLAEANQLTTDGKFDEAYDFFAYLLKFYPNTPSLAEARQNYLYLSAGAAFRQQKHEEALAILEELLAQNPNYRAAAGGQPLLTVLGNIADSLLAGMVERKDFGSARALLARLARQYRADNEPFVQRWRQQLADLATRHRDEARQHLQAGRHVQAQDACRMMRQIWPTLAGADELVAEIARLHPMVTVGVDHPALAFDTLSLHDVAARRAGRLTQRLLVELVGLGSEGGQYECPLGTLSHRDDGLALQLRLTASPGGLTANELAGRLLFRADPASPEYQSAWGNIVAAVRRQGANEVEVDLKFPHVLPEALLRGLIGSPSDHSAEALSPYAIHSQDGATTRFLAKSDYAFRRPGQPSEVVERYFEDPEQALRALQGGEIDLLDRVFPGDIAALESDRDIVVTPYQAPTTHILIVRGQHPYLSSRTFRRALLYGSNRELLLTQGLMRGKSLRGFRVVSGPFPAPTAGGDALAYGYDRQIEPRPYDPRLGLTLRLLAEGELKSAYAKQQKEPPALTPLMLGHPADESSRIACRGLARQWKQIGVECKLAEFRPGVFDDKEQKCDLVYAQLAAWEPIVDARRLFGPDGLAPAESSFIQLTLRQLANARNWQEARQQLLHLHRLVHEDVSVVPLWQTVDHFAYRRGLQGLSPSRIRLYQDIEQWQAATQLARTGP
jgi:hypothetical protein